MESFDVVIVGAGPAGCMAGYFLNKKLKVLLVDKQRLPRNKVCGGLLNPVAYSALPVTPPKDVFLEENFFPINSYNLEKNKKLQLLSVYNINRFLFDKWLVDLIKGKITIRDETRLTRIKELDGDGFLLSTRHKGKETQVKTRYLVGCDGNSFIVRKLLGVSVPERWFAVQKWYKNGGKLRECYAFYDFKISKGFSWLIPKDDRLIIAGIYEFKEKVLEKYNHFEKEIKRKFDLPEESPIKKEGGFLVRMKNFSDINIGNESGVLLAGESAALLNNTSGEGLSFALKSGKSAALAINSFFPDSKRVFRKYRLLNYPEVLRTLFRFLPIYINDRVLKIESSFLSDLALQLVYGKWTNKRNKKFYNHLNQP